MPKKLNPLPNKAAIVLVVLLFLLIGLIVFG